MIDHEGRLWQRLRAVRRRWLAVSGLSGAAWAAVGTIVLVWEFPWAWRAAAWIAAVGGGLVVLVERLVRAVWAARDSHLARRLDAVGQSGGAILTGWELCRPLHDAYRDYAPELSAGLAQMAVGHAAGLAVQVPSSAAVPARPLGRAVAAVALLATLAGAAALLVPGVARTQWHRWLHPLSDLPPYSPIEIQVEPGDTAVVYGGPLEIRAITSGGAVETVELVLEEPLRLAESLPMFAEPDQRWRAALARVTARAVYYVRAERARSPRYQIRVLTVPQIKEVRVEIRPPAYTRLPATAGPLPKDGIAGLSGTEVQIRAASNRPLRGGKLVLSGQGASEEVSLAPAAAGAQEVAGTFTVRRSGKFQLHVEDVDGQASQDSVSGSIVLLADHRPFIRLLKPAASSLATPTALLPVV